MDRLAPRPQIIMTLTGSKHEADTTSVEPPYSIFTPHQRALIVTIVSVGATFTSSASNIYFPSIPTIAKDLSVTAELVNLTVTSYMIFQGLSPTVWGSIADVSGRRITYIFTFVIFFSSCIGLANTKHYYQLVILRCMQSTGSASTIALGAGVIGDITTRAERGGYMGYFQAGLLVPLAVGPIIGGAFAQTLGWRSIFWFLTIYSGVFLVFLIILLPETLRSMVGNGSIPPKGFAVSLLAYVQRRRHLQDSTISTAEPSSQIASEKKPHLDLLGPIRIFFSTEVTFAILFLSIYYTVWQMAVTVMPTLFSRLYGLSEIQIGLTFIANGVGTILGTISTGKLLDYDYRSVRKQYTGDAREFPLEKARLRTLWLWSGIQCAATLVFGWTLQKHVHLSAPLICTFFIGWSSTSIYVASSTYIVDIFPDRSASATAAANLSRCLIGAGGTAAVLPIVNAINVGWTFTLFTGIQLLGLGLIVVQLTYGAKKRLQKTVREDGES